MLVKLQALVVHLLTDARKFTAAAVGTVTLVVPIVFGAGSSFVSDWAVVVAILTTVGVYVVPNARRATPARRAPAKSARRR